MIRHLAIVALCAIALCASCITAPVCITSSTTPIINKTITENLGRVSGLHRTWALLGAWMFRRPDMDEAIRDALSAKGGDALINVRCYQTTTWYLFFSIISVTVEGDAVRFEAAGAKDVKKGK